MIINLRMKTDMCPMERFFCLNDGKMSRKGCLKYLEWMNHQVV